MDSLKLEFLSYLKCPTNWSEIVSEPILVRFLQLYWLETMRKYEVSCESSYYSRPAFDEIEEGDSRLSADLVNIRRWYPLALDQYLKETRLFRELRLTTPQEYPKHFLLRAASRQEVVERTKNGTSYFYSEYNNDNIGGFLWASITQRWRECLDSDKVLFFYKELSYPVGASHGQDARIICFHVEPSNALVHAYPITDGEVPSGVFVSKMYNYGDGKDGFQEKEFGGTFDVTIDD